MRHPLILMYLGFGSYLWSGVLGGDFDVGTQNHFTAGGNSTWLSDNTTHPDNQRRWSGAAPAPVSDVDWERYKCKGRKLLLQMQLTDRDVGQALPVPQDTVQSQFHFG